MRNWRVSQENGKTFATLGGSPKAVRNHDQKLQNNIRYQVGEDGKLVYVAEEPIEESSSTSKKRKVVKSVRKTTN